ncbi:serine--tRNA ligase-like [Babylonia areolata]|uniref:serine--tRNA ligase-like n=1 Tax=Babylonia areolata TaxID=304850 RepID=UPI003FD22568
MSHSLLYFPRLCQSFARGHRALLSVLKTQKPKAIYQQTCSFCLRCHQQLFSKSPQTRLPGLVTAAKQLHHEKQTCSVKDVEPDLSASSSPEAWGTPFVRPEPKLNWEYLCDAQNYDSIRANITNRKGVGNIDRVKHLLEKHESAETAEEKGAVWQELLAEAASIPNATHPLSPVGEESEATVVEVHSERREFNFTPKTVVELGEQLQMLRTDNLSLTTGPRTYYFLGQLALLEQALVRFTLSKLKEKGFQLVSVPDLLHPDVIESCGFKTRGERTQVYHLSEEHGQVCLAGTAEMSLAGLFMNEVLDLNDLPKRVAAVSRCYRAETSDIAEEKGIYRVHQFTKVEMFGVTADEDGEESEGLLEELVRIERELFTSLGLHFRILDMPTEELGAPAYRKFDIETWMPGRSFWGEISSASNCTDFQSRRLNIQYRDNEGSLKFVHTVNGTACAVPRMVMALLENNQQEDGSVVLPEVLEPWLGSTVLTPPRRKDPYIRLHDRRKR